MILADGQPHGNCPDGVVGSYPGTPRACRHSFSPQFRAGSPLRWEPVRIRVQRHVTMGEPEGSPRQSGHGGGGPISSAAGYAQYYAHPLHRLSVTGCYATDGAG